VRADNLALLTDAGKAAVVEYGVRTIIDLRKPDEIAAHPNPFAEGGLHDIRYINVSLIDPGAFHPDFTTQANDYKAMLDRYPGAIAEIMTGIARAPEGAVLIHCMGGKDRTGVISALLLDLAGVPRGTIAEDYGLTAECLRPRDEEWLENGPGTRAWREQEMERRMPHPEVMLEVLGHLDERYGGVEEYLLQAGMTGEDIASIRRRLIATDLAGPDDLAR
jgi:protein tyrosine/serine phosphatase